MAKLPQVARPELLNVAIVPLPDQVALTVSGNWIPGTGGGPPGLPAATSDSDCGRPRQRSVAFTVACKLALCTSLPTTKSESGIMKHSEPATEDPSMVTKSSVACCMSAVPPEFCVGLKTNSLRLT